MPRHCKRRIMLLSTAAFFITVLCMGVVHNASIKRPTDIEAVKVAESNLDDDSVDGMVKDGHAFEPESLKEAMHERDEPVHDGADVDQRKAVEEDDDAAPELIPNRHGVDVDDDADDVDDDADDGADDGDEVVAVAPIKVADAAGEVPDAADADEKADDDFQMIAQPVHNGQVEQGARALKFEPDVELKPREPIFGVGERIVENPKPLPVVKAPLKIDAYVDAHPQVQQAENLLDLDALGPPDHLDAVRMEQDGHINTNYQKEIFFGEHEAYENLSDEEMEKRLKEIFYKVDRSENGFITVDELEDWIIEKTNEHFEEAERENKQIFMSLDSDSNGYITWKEFEVQFLVALGHSEQDAKMYAKGRDEDIPLDIEDRERLRRYKYKWSEAETEPLDNRLTVDEFQSFRHPESSKDMVQQMADEILQYLDTNKDDELTEHEFISLPEADYDDDTPNGNWQQKRSSEFKNVIDTNHDGRASRDELVAYIDPQNRNHARMEARNLLELGDNNGDDRLSLDEVIDNMDLFYGSKMVNTGLSFHDEF